MSEIDDEELRAILPRLRRFALSLTREPAAADDLVQNCLERALSRWGSKRSGGSTQSWLFAILYRQFIDGSRRARRLARLLSWFGDPDAMAASTEDLVLARSALDMFGDLPAEQRALLVLTVVEGVTYREAAEILGVPMGTVMSRLSSARRRLRTLVDGEMEQPRLRVVK
ncbi:sigma-70 family RNA polymerase sigma factor [Geminicoccus roseus]|uniref:sigma-70 family RNA polymerase sigma factor n=1 Tax=Geminicoccus roseus TaxID=404900 RepID=UPI0004235229|nr:sigma-70 family RNA polymerase sigma factor [Geminicoccus roseus]